MDIPEGMTSEKLRDIADWLDTYDRMALAYIGLYERMHLGPTDNVEEALATVRGNDVQDDLRSWADQIDTAEAWPDAALRIADGGRAALMDEIKCMCGHPKDHHTQRCEGTRRSGYWAKRCLCMHYEPDDYGA